MEYADDRHQTRLPDLGSPELSAASPQTAVAAPAMMRSVFSGSKYSYTGTVPAITLTNWSFAAWLV
jgi:hypothetical protein